MDYLIVYDVSDMNDRMKLIYILLKYGYHIGYSTFFLPNMNKKKLETILKEINSQLEFLRSHRIFIYPVKKVLLFKGFPLKPWNMFVL